MCVGSVRAQRGTCARTNGEAVAAYFQGAKGRGGGQLASAAGSPMSSCSPEQPRAKSQRITGPASLADMKDLMAAYSAGC